MESGDEGDAHSWQINTDQSLFLHFVDHIRESEDQWL